MQTYGSKSGIGCRCCDMKNGDTRSRSTGRRHRSNTVSRINHWMRKVGRRQAKKEIEDISVDVK